MALLCREIAIVSLFLILLQVFTSGHTWQLFTSLHTLDFWFVQLQVRLYLSVGHIVTCCYLITSRFFRESCYHWWGPLFACWILHHDILTEIQVMQSKFSFFVFVLTFSASKPNCLLALLDMDSCDLATLFCRICMGDWRLLVKGMLW